jgi:hypothetical protein
MVVVRRGPSSTPPFHPVGVFNSRSTGCLFCCCFTMAIAVVVPEFVSHTHEGWLFLGYPDLASRSVVVLFKSRFGSARFSFKTLKQVRWWFLFPVKICRFLRCYSWFFWPPLSTPWVCFFFAAIVLKPLSGLLCLPAPLVTGYGVVTSYVRRLLLPLQCTDRIRHDCRALGLFG